MFSTAHVHGDVIVYSCHQMMAFCAAARVWYPFDPYEFAFFKRNTSSAGTAIGQPVHLEGDAKKNNREITKKSGEYK